MRRLSISLVILSLFGWAAFWTVGTFDLFANAPEVRHLIYGVGLTLTAITLVVFLAEFFLNTILADAFQFESSGLIKAITYAALTCITSVTLLSQFGVDVGAILTTSAIVGAVVGLSMQSTLGSIISGMSMSAEPLLKIGSAVRFENRTVIIEQKTWRHIVGRRLDNIRVIIPNSMLANMPILVLPEDGPTRFDVFVHLPPDVPPQLITDLLSEAFVDIEHLDATRAVMVTPIETQPGLDSIHYRIRLWARTYSQVSILKGEVLRRTWYVLSRSGIRQPRHNLYEASAWVGISNTALHTYMRDYGILKFNLEAESNIKQYRFAPAEVLHFPPSEVGRNMIIVGGQVSAGVNPYFNPIEYGRTARPHLPTMNVQKLSTAAIVRKIADQLAIETGPIAEKLVRDAMKSSVKLHDALVILSENISDDIRREKFLTTTQSWFLAQIVDDNEEIATLTLDASGRVSPAPELRAVSEVLAVTFSQSPR
jgi:small-conductance mechanosensitive channel